MFLRYIDAHWKDRQQLIELLCCCSSPFLFSRQLISMSDGAGEGKDRLKANEILINRLIDLFSNVYSSLTKKEEEEEHFHIFSITRSTDPCEKNLNE